MPVSRRRATSAGTSNTNLGAAKYEFGGMYFASFTVNTARYSPIFSVFANTGRIWRSCTSAPSHRADEPPGPQALSRKTSQPYQHWSYGSFRARCANAMFRCLRALPFASSRRPLTQTLCHSQWPKPPRFVCTRIRTSPIAAEEPPSSRDPTTRLLRRSPRHP